MCTALRMMSLSGLLLIVIMTAATPVPDPMLVSIISESDPYVRKGYENVSPLNSFYWLSGK